MKLNEIYSNPEQQQKRYKELVNILTQNNYQLSSFARAPGRVNIISEHTDYNGYQVSPIALECDYVFAIGTKTGKQIIHICHKDNQNHKDDEFSYQLDKSQISKPNGQWSQYVRAGYHAALTYDDKLVDQFKNQEIMLIGTGNVPLGSGLSSSSALTCCSALAFLQFSKIKIDHSQLAAIVAKSEATVAIEGGGMDQAISLCAERGKVSVINFNPLKLEFHKLPEGIKVAVFSSLKDSRKATGDCNFYNTRVAECRAGCALLMQKLTIQKKTVFNPEEYKVLMCYDVQKAYDAQSPSQMLSSVEELPEHITLKNLTQQLGYNSYDRMIELLFSATSGKCLLLNINENTSITIKRRLRHVYSEAFRAKMFERTLTQYDADSKDLSLQAISDFIDDSQASCRDDYECSCQELNLCIQKAKQSGAFCARLTGAGMGGFAVGLVHDIDCEQFLKLMGEFYKAKGITNIDEVLFITEAGAGGCYVKLE